jgi:hypothetical protein
VTTRLFVRACVCALCAQLPHVAVRAQVRQPSSLEYEVKAAFLFNFLGFTDWPGPAFARPEDPVQLCIAAPDPFGQAIDALMKPEKVHGRPIIIERLSGDDSAANCTLLFVPAAASPQWIDRAGPYTLTVGESETFLAQGGMIALVVDGGRVRFDVHVDAASSRGLRISARVLRLARHTVSVPAR